MTTTSTAIEQEERPTDEQLFRAAIVARMNAIIREFGDAAYLEFLEGVGPEHARTIMQAMDWFDERQEAMGRA